MPLWTCDFERCRRPAVRTLGDCVLCNRHLCSNHLQPELHSCPRWEDADAYDPAAREAEELIYAKAYPVLPPRFGMTEQREVL
ncbi:AN1-like zinc finger domain-containing protein [Hirsutella rhossiliensis]|uniref:AN1-like zinc finger domain-containing protein n=1 Tax=Hirsutella rhossiliensis TaxID=111463 RepID=A0A9P8MYC8_9HYPO|nr:AN1-like zinc finger domain-containing protein [Hirsutella rhossiliensis]KAH0963510.1 AN1-like zinc finger domain-containing protein [Hirsutella rhossiliensis]